MLRIEDTSQRPGDRELVEERAEAELANLQHDYDARGERLWRLATAAGHESNPSDNDASAELTIATALAEVSALRERLARVEAMADDNNPWVWTAPVGPGNASYANGYENGRCSLADDLRAALADTPDREAQGEAPEVKPAAVKSSGQPVDLLAALQQSITAAKQAKGEAGDRRG